MTKQNKVPRYRAYLLRLWETGSLDSGRGVTWRFSLEDPRTGEKRGFADLEGLVAFLESETGEEQEDRE